MQGFFELNNFPLNTKLTHAGSALPDSFTNGSAFNLVKHASLDAQDLSMRRTHQEYGQR